MSYVPRKNYGVTAQATGRTVDGTPTYCSAASFASGSGGQDSTSIGYTMTQLLTSRGGALRSDGTFVPIPGNHTPGGITGRFDGFARETSGTHRVRNVAGGAWTGTGNVLTGVVVILEFI